MLYNDVLKKTIAARDAIVSAIVERGGTVDSNATLIQCSKAIKSLVTSTTKPAPSGQIFHASFASDSEYAESGQPLVKVGSPQFVVEDGIMCMKLESSAVYTKFPCFLGNTPFTVSFWGKAPETISNEFHIIWAGENKTYGKVHFEIVAGKFGISDSQSFFYTENVVTGSFHHFLVTYDGAKLVAYVDGKFATQSGNFTANVSLSNMFVGKTVNTTEAGPFFISTLRIFTRVLSADEISTLYDEFVNRDKRIPQSGLKFYASLKNSFVAETGQTLNESLCANLDGVVFGNVDGVPCASYSNGNTANAFYNLIDNYASPLTVSYWGKANGEPDCHISLRRQETTSLQRIPGTVLTTIDFDSLTVTEAEVAELANAETVNNDIVHHYCYTQDGSSVKIFKDGILLNSVNRSLSYNDGRIYLEIGINNGSIGSVRVYNRALSEDEVKILASEFTPTTT